MSIRMMISSMLRILPNLQLNVVPRLLITSILFLRIFIPPILTYRLGVCAMSKLATIEANNFWGKLNARMKAVRWQHCSVCMQTLVSPEWHYGYYHSPQRCLSSASVGMTTVQASVPPHPPAGPHCTEPVVTAALQLG